MCDTLVVCAEKNSFCVHIHLAQVTSLRKIVINLLMFDHTMKLIYVPFSACFPQMTLQFNSIFDQLLLSKIAK